MNAQTTATKHLQRGPNRKDMAACIFDVIVKPRSTQSSENGFRSRWPGIKGLVVAILLVMVQTKVSNYIKVCI